MTSLIAARRRLLAAAVALGALSPAVLSPAQAQAGFCDETVANPADGVRESSVELYGAGTPQLGSRITKVAVKTGKAWPGPTPRGSLKLGNQFGPGIEASLGDLTPEQSALVKGGSAVFRLQTEDGEWSGADGKVLFATAGVLTPKVDSFADLKGPVRVEFYAAGVSPEDGKPLLTLTADRATVAAGWSAALAAKERQQARFEKLECRTREKAASPIGCFLTTAAVETIGLADDCWELATLRRFRDGWLANQPGGAEDIARYYAEAPAIAAALRSDPRALARLYWRDIVPSAVLAKLGFRRLARARYTAMMRRLDPAA